MDKFFDTLPRTFGSVPLTWAVMLRVERERECEDDRELAQQDDKEMGRTRARARTYAALLDALPPPSRALLVDVERRFWADWNSADAICVSVRSTNCVDVRHPPPFFLSLSD